MKILLCLDDTPLSWAALENCLVWFTPLRPSVTLLHVISEVDERFHHYERLFEEELREIEKTFGDTGPSVEILTRAQEQLTAQGWITSREIRVGDPAEEILSEARQGEYDLIVLGSHGRSDLTALILGSVSHKVIREAHCPVLVVRGSSAAGRKKGQG